MSSSRKTTVLKDCLRKVDDETYLFNFDKLRDYASE